MDHLQIRATDPSGEITQEHRGQLAAAAVARSSDTERIQQRRTRKLTEPEQLEVLQRVFAQNPYPSTDRRKEIGSMIGMNPRTVQIWFQNARQRAKNAAQSTLFEAESRPACARKTPYTIPQRSLSPSPPAPSSNALYSSKPLVARLPRRAPISAHQRGTPEDAQLPGSSDEGCPFQLTTKDLEETFVHGPSHANSIPDSARSISDDYWSVLQRQLAESQILVPELVPLSLGHATSIYTPAGAFEGDFGFENYPIPLFFPRKKERIRHD